MVSFAPSKVHVFEVLCHVWVEPVVLVAISLSFLLFFPDETCLKLQHLLLKSSKTSSCYIYIYILFVFVCILVFSVVVLQLCWCLSSKHYTNIDIVFISGLDWRRKLDE